MISVVILTYRRRELLEKCLASAAAAERADVGEVIVAVNGDDPEGAAAARSWSPRLPRLRVLELTRASRGRARNLAADAAAAPVVYFLDDDAQVTPGVFSAVARHMRERPRAACVGGPNLTPAESTPFQAAVGRVLSSRLGAGPLRARYAAVGASRRADESALMLCSLALRRELFAQGFRFDEDLVSAEENLLLERLRCAGRELYYDPRLVVYHHRRATWGGFAAQTFKSGVGRAQAVRRLPACLKAHHLAPALLCGYALFLAAHAGRPAAWAPALLYGALLSWEGLLYAFAGGGLIGGARVIALTALQHAAYGAGFLAGITLPGRILAAA